MNREKEIDRDRVRDFFHVEDIIFIRQYEFLFFKKGDKDELRITNFLKKVKKIRIVTIKSKIYYIKMMKLNSNSIGRTSNPFLVRGEK